MEKTAIELQSALTRWYGDRNDAQLKTVIKSLADTPDTNPVPEVKKEVTIPEFLEDGLLDNDPVYWMNILEIIIEDPGENLRDGVLLLTLEQWKYLIDNAGENVKYIAALYILSQIFGSQPENPLDIIPELECFDNLDEILKELPLELAQLQRFYAGIRATTSLAALRIRLLLLRVAYARFRETETVELKKFTESTAQLLAGSSVHSFAHREDDIIKELDKFSYDELLIALWKYEGEMGNNLRILVKAKICEQIQSLMNEGKSDTVLNLIKM